MRKRQSQCQLTQKLSRSSRQIARNKKNKIRFIVTEEINLCPMIFNFYIYCCPSCCNVIVNVFFILFYSFFLCVLEVVKNAVPLVVLSVLSSAVLFVLIVIVLLSADWSLSLLSMFSGLWGRLFLHFKTRTVFECTL